MKELKRWKNKKRGACFKKGKINALSVYIRDVIRKAAKKDAPGGPNLYSPPEAIEYLKLNTEGWWDDYEAAFEKVEDSVPIPEFDESDKTSRAQAMSLFGAEVYKKVLAAGFHYYTKDDAWKFVKFKFTDL